MPACSTRWARSRANASCRPSCSARPTTMDRCRSGSGQTISQPYIVAYMTEALDVAPSHKVLEVGTGSGYQAAVLSELVREVYTVEIVPELARQAEAVLRSLNRTNVHVRAGDGYAGWPEEAPFDRIIVTAAPEDIPRPLIDQLATGGRWSRRSARRASRSG